MVSVTVAWLPLKQERTAIFLKLAIIKFHENPFSGSGLLRADGQTDRLDETHMQCVFLLRMRRKQTLSVGGLPKEKVNRLKNKCPP